MLDRLPTELQITLIELCEDLRYLNRYFYQLCNQVYKVQTLRLCHLNNDMCIHDKLFRRYQKSLSFFNGVLSEMLQPEINWHMAYSFVKNRKLFFTPEKIMIQPFQENQGSLSYEFTSSNSVKLNDVQAFVFNTSIVLPKGEYTLQLGLVNHTNSRGLGTVDFRVTHRTLTDDEVEADDLVFTADSIDLNSHYNISHQDYYYPSTFISDVLPVGWHSVLRLGRLEVSQAFEKLDIVVSEAGMYPKNNIEFEFLEITELPQFTDDDFSFYTYGPPESILEPEKELEVLNYLALQGEIVPNDYKKEINWVRWYTQGHRDVKMNTPILQQNVAELRTNKPDFPLSWKVRF